PPGTAPGAGPVRSSGAGARWGRSVVGRRRLGCLVGAGAGLGDLAALGRLILVGWIWRVGATLVVTTIVGIAHTLSDTRRCDQAVTTTGTRGRVPLEVQRPAVGVVDAVANALP